MILSFWTVLFLVDAAPLVAPQNDNSIGAPLPQGALVRLGSLRDRLANAQTPVAIMPDGKTIVTGERRGLRFLDIATGKETGFFPLRSQRVLTIAVSPNGKHIAVTLAHEDVRRDGSISQSIYVWDVAAKKVLWNRGGVGYSYPQAGFASNGRILVMQRIDWEHDKRVDLLHADTESGSDSGGDLKANCFSTSPDGKTTAYGTDGGTLHIHDSSNLVSQVLEFKPQSIDRMAWSSDARMLAVASRSKEPPDKKNESLIRRLAIIDAAAIKVIFDSPVSEEITALAFSPDTRILGVQTNDGLHSSLRFCESASGKVLWPALNQPWWLPIPLPLADGMQITVQRTEANRVLVTFHSRTRRELGRWWTDENLRPAHVIARADRKLVICGTPFAIFDHSTGKDLGDRAGHRHSIRSMQFSLDGSNLISIDRSDDVRAWRPLDPQKPESHSGPRHVRGSARILKDGTRIYVDFDGTIRVRRAANDRESSFRVEGILSSPSAFDITASGMLAVRTSAGIALWDLFQGRRLALLDDRGPFGRSLHFSPDGRFLLIELADGNARLFAVSPKRLDHVRADLDFTFTTARFSPDAKWLVGMANSKVRIIDLRAGKNVAVDGTFKEFAFSPADSAVAVRKDDNTHRLLLLPSGQEMRTLRVGDSLQTLCDTASACTIAMSDPAGEKVVFSPDGRLFAVVGEQVTIHESATSQRIGQLPDGHSDGVSAFAFSPDGKHIATGGDEGTILIWDWAAACGLVVKGSRPLESLWRGVLDADAGKAYGALWAMRNEPQKTVALLQRELTPAVRDFKDIRALVAQLDSDNFRSREAASRALRLLGSEAEPFLRLALSKPTSTEAEKRIHQLLADPGMEKLGAEIIRTIRAIHLLESMGTPEAMALLRELAGGDLQRIVTRAARANKGK